MIGCSQTRVCKQLIIALYFEFENERGLALKYLEKHAMEFLMINAEE